MAILKVKKTITKARAGKNDVGGDMCSTHNKKRKAEYLVDDGAGGMCCSPGDECKGSKEGGAEKACKWCEQGECWSHGQIEKPERNGRKGKKGDVDGDVCSAHGKSRKAEYLIDDGAGGMCCSPGDECKSKESGAAGKPERKRRGKADESECKWCEQGECWSHGQIEKPAGRKGGQQTKGNRGKGKGKGKGKGGKGGGGMWVYVNM